MENKFDECNTPFTKCWCEAVPARQNNPHCKSLIPSVPIESTLLTIIIVVGIFIYVFLKSKSPKKLRVVFSAKNEFTPKMRMRMEEMKKLNYHFNQVKKSRFERFYDSATNLLSGGKSFAPNELKSFR